MAIFTSSSGKTSKRTTPRGGSTNPIFSQSSTPTSEPQQQQQRLPAHRCHSFSAFAPEKTGDDIATSNPVPGTMAGDAGRPPLARGSSVASNGKTCLLDQNPESMVAETLRMRGELEFTRLLRVDGKFEGALLTDKGSLVVGPKGEVIGDLKNMQEVYVEGIVRGNVYAQDVKVKNNGMLFGDIQCVSLTVDPTASVKGVADTVTPRESELWEAKPPPPPSISSTTSSRRSSQPVPPPSLKLPPLGQGQADSATLRERATLEASAGQPEPTAALAVPAGASPAAEAPPSADAAEIARAPSNTVDNSAALPAGAPLSVAPSSAPMAVPVALSSQGVAPGGSPGSSPSKEEGQMNGVKLNAAALATVGEEEKLPLSTATLVPPPSS